MAARVASARVQAMHKSLHHLIAKADWSDEAVLSVMRQQLLPSIERYGVIRARIVDRHGVSQEGSAFCRRGAAVLRPARQAGQLSGSQ